MTVIHIQGSNEVCLRIVSKPSNLLYSFENDDYLVKERFSTTYISRFHYIGEWEESDCQRTYGAEYAMAE